MTLFQLVTVTTIVMFARLESVISMSDMENQHRINYCIELVNKVDTLDEFLSSFSRRFTKLSEQLMSQWDLSICLNIAIYLDTFKHVSGLTRIITLGQEQDVCSYDFVWNHLNVYHETMLAENPNSRIGPLFKFYVNKVMTKCSLVAPDKIKELDNDGIWIDNFNIIEDAVRKTNSINLRPSSEKSTKVLHTITSADFKNLIFDAEIDDFESSKVPTITIPFSGNIIKNILMIRSACQHVTKYQQNVLYAVALLASKGYRSYNSDSKTSSAHDTTFNWLAVAQFCEVIKRIQVRALVDPDSGDRVAIRLKMTKNFLKDAIEEIDSELLKWPRHLKYHQYSDQHITNIVELSESVKEANLSCQVSLFEKLATKLQCTATNRERMIKSIEKSLYNANFLKIFAKYSHEARHNQPRKALD